jgi:16S rRNA (cytosine967-C5)-methyltransferase
VPVSQRDAIRTASVKAAPARRCAYTVLRRVFERGAYSDQALQAESRELDARDRSLAMRLAYGAVQRRATLDYLIEGLASRPVTRLDAPVLAALRLGLYELLYMDGAPDHAIVADTVELAKTRGGSGHGLVNAVLRRGAREGRALLEALDDHTPERAAVKHSHPEWIANLWWRELGPEQARALMAHDNEPGELALRVNTLLADPAEVARELPVGSHPDHAIQEALILEGPFDLHRSPLWRSGALMAQSRGAMLVARALAPEAGERVLDLCAAPGGKTTHLAALMQGQGEVVAVEHNPRRAGELVRAAQRLHAGNVRVEVADAAAPRSEGAVFDRVLVDPPCSGLGTLQARADLRWRATAERARAMVDIQASILAAGADAVRPGGVLVYSTCTISSTENERQIATFLDSHRDFLLDDLGSELPELALSRVQELGCSPPTPGSAEAVGKLVLTLPHRDRTAGFFIARMRRG